MIAAGVVVLWLAAGTWLHAAEPPSGAAAKPTTAEKARQLYLAGLEAQQRRDWKAAYEAFAEAWEINGHYQIAGNLGSVEMELGRHCAAAEHLAQALSGARESGEAAPAEVRTLEALLAEATDRVARLHVRVHLGGGELKEGHVWIDGEPQPWRTEMFVEPGTHTIEVRAPGWRSPRHQVDATAGSIEHVQLGAHLAPTPKTVAFASEADRGEAGSQAPVVPASMRPLWPAVVGGSVALVSAALAVAAVVVAGQRRSDAEQLADEISATTGLPGSVACSGPPEANLPSCAEWESAGRQSGAWWSAAAAGFVVAGGASVGTLLYLLWPAEAAEAQEPAAKLGMGPTGLVLRGRF